MSSIIRMAHREIAIHRFMGIVKSEARKARVVILYGDGGPTERSGWHKWMAESEFRAGVLARCFRLPYLGKCEFHPPCEYDGWTFGGYVKEDRRPWT